MNRPRVRGTVLRAQTGRPTQSATVRVVPVVPVVPVPDLTEDEKSGCALVYAAFVDALTGPPRSFNGKDYLDVTALRVHRLARTSPSHRAFMGEIKTCDAAVYYLARAGARMRLAPCIAMALIQALAAGNDRNRVKLGVVSADIVRLMKVWSGDTHFLWYGCGAMSILAQVGVNKRMLVDAGAREVLQELLRRPDALLEHTSGGNMRDRTTRLLTYLNV